EPPKPEDKPAKPFQKPGRSGRPAVRGTPSPVNLDSVPLAPHAFGLLDDDVQPAGIRGREVSVRLRVHDPKTRAAR
ncbi:MAG: hypothetical protein II486_10255, partial [Thermoguttaceae bacterium]|nr:hypothetical protein [Thermoguttaceae bacterium]